MTHELKSAIVRLKVATMRYQIIAIVNGNHFLLGEGDFSEVPVLYPAGKFSKSIQDSSGGEWLTASCGSLTAVCAHIGLAREFVPQIAKEAAGHGWQTWGRTTEALALYRPWKVFRLKPGPGAEFVSW